MDVSYSKDTIPMGWAVTASNGKRSATTIVTEDLLKDLPEMALKAVATLANLAFREIQNPELQKALDDIEQQLAQD